MQKKTMFKFLPKKYASIEKIDNIHGEMRSLRLALSF